MTELEQYRPYLRWQTQISLPQLQLYLKCSYPEAKEVLQMLQEARWADTQVEGIFYPLNEKLMFPRELSQQECQAYAELLSARQVRALEILAGEKEAQDSPRMRMYQDALEELQRQGLAHMFGGRCYASVTEETARRIKDQQIQETDDVLLAFISNPIMVNAVAQDANAESVLESPFVPQECKDYIRRGILLHLVNKSRPSPVRFTGKADVRTLSYELVESMVRQRDHSTKEEYEEDARESLECIESSALCSEEFKEAARLATEQICQELTFSNLREIRHIILSQEEDDDDVEDPEDD